MTHIEKIIEGLNPKTLKPEIFVWSGFMVEEGKGLQPIYRAYNTITPDWFGSQIQQACLENDFEYKVYVRCE